MKLAARVKKVTLTFLVMFFLTGCGAIGNTSPTPIPTVALGGSSAPLQSTPQVRSGDLVASGITVPAQEAQMAFASGGELEEVNIEVGDKVETGQVLARLAGTEQLQATLSAAELDVISAEQALNKLDDDLLKERTVALQALNLARKAVRDAQREVNGFGVSTEPIDIQVARSNVALAKRALDQAQKDFKPYENKPENNFKRAALLNKLSDAQKRYDNAVEQLNRLTGVIVPEFDFQQAQTELEIAQSQLILAEDRVELLRNGPDPDAVSLAQARLKSAQDRAAAARASLLNLELKAPFAGTVSKVNFQSGEWVIPGQPVLTLADLDHLRVETTDLSELDVPRIELGQLVTLVIDALNQEITGRVSQIAPLADTLGGDVVYKTTIDLDSLPPGLRAGMSVEAQFDTGQ
jgi:multidrug efflux pump subunit AcrA (membrane-fusion protein)